MDADTLLSAAAGNHQSWYGLQARATGGEVVRRDGAVWAHVPSIDADATQPGRIGSATILFPNGPRSALRQHVREAVRFCRERLPLGTAGCWTLRPGDPAGLAASCLAHGFEWGWQPHWMSLSIATMREPRLPAGVTITDDTDPGVWSQFDHPYHSDSSPTFWRSEVALSEAVAAQDPASTRRLIAWLDGRPVGAGVVHVGGPAGVAGIYDVGVLGDLRNRGIGRVVTAALCRLGAELGCTWSLLNATPLGEPVYRALGYRSLGHGQTWWMHAHRLEAPPPDGVLVGFVEALGDGDLDALDALARTRSIDMDAALPCGLAAVEVAALLGRADSARWLEEKGATIDVLSARALGWRDRIPELLRRRPELTGLRRREDGATPLHVAAYDGDLDLVRTLLAHGADPATLDARFSSTPAGWARHGGRADIAEVIEGGAPTP